MSERYLAPFSNDDLVSGNYPDGALVKLLGIPRNVTRVNGGLIAYLEDHLDNSALVEIQINEYHSAWDRLLATSTANRPIVVRGLYVKGAEYSGGPAVFVHEIDWQP